MPRTPPPLIYYVLNPSPPNRVAPQSHQQNNRRCIVQCPDVGDAEPNLQVPIGKVTYRLIERSTHPPPVIGVHIRYHRITISCGAPVPSLIILIGHFLTILHIQVLCRYLFFFFFLRGAKTRMIPTDCVWLDSEYQAALVRVWNLSASLSPSMVRPNY